MMFDRSLDCFKELDKQAPPRPDHTCPHIDKAIESLESLREQNEQLREHGKYWRNTCEELDHERQSLRTQLKMVRGAKEKLENSLDSLTDALE